MDRITVTSSNIRSIGYDPTSETLEVEFRSGELYQYTGVPAVAYQGIMKAESHSKYLNAHIKGRFPYRHIR